MTLKAKGYDLKLPPIRDSYDRRAQQFANNIVETLRKLGVHEDDVNVELQAVARRAGVAKASWYQEGQNLEYSFQACKKYAENLWVVWKVISLKAKEVLDGQLSLDDFLLAFSEDDDVEQQRKAARRILGVEEDCSDLQVISKQYKKLAMKYHPDRDTGDLEMFKKINAAHRTLKRELE